MRRWQAILLSRSVLVMLARDQRRHQTPSSATRLPSRTSLDMTIAPTPGHEHLDCAQHRRNRPTNAAHYIARQVGVANTKCRTCP